ncbi:MAG: hypothetical protein RIC04_14985 [Parvibaculum sp.]|uniref:hypothetical protein n=1 Tax=Parvibaculum sp. TaxID=2024848 RepID=UPI0032ED115A
MDIEVLAEMRNHVSAGVSRLFGAGLTGNRDQILVQDAREGYRRRLCLYCACRLRMGLLWGVVSEDESGEHFLSRSFLGRLGRAQYCLAFDWVVGGDIPDGAVGAFCEPEFAGGLSVVGHATGLR